MKKYSIHYVYIIVIVVLLLLTTYESFKTITEPTYSPPGRYIPRALLWYFCAAVWWEFLFVAFRIEIIENNRIKTFSILKRDIVKPKEVIQIKENRLSYTVLYSGRKTIISNLIDDIGNAMPLIINQQVIGRTRFENISFGKLLLKIFFILLLIGFALYVELDHYSRIPK